jgi:4'-phosphopantetheinyl transferase EntD
MKWQMSAPLSACELQRTETLRARCALLASLFGSRVATAGTDPRAEISSPFPDEEALVAAASPGRRLEFLNGRACAHQALRELGVPDVPVLRGRDREPRWPAHVVGSISHGDDFCGAAVALRDDHAGVGVDMEADHALSADFARRVCSPRELARCAQLGPEGLFARVLFSAKESVYKLQYPLSGAVLYWRDLEILLEDARFSARFLRPCPPFREGQVLLGRWLRGSGLILTGATFNET